MLIFVRHGATELNGTGSHEALRGWLDVPLSRIGMHEAAKAAEALTGLKPSSLYCSHLIRAVQTAQCIGQALDIVIEPSQEFAPWNVGTLAGQKVQDILPEMLRLVYQHPDEQAPGGGESFNAFLNRFVPAVKRVVASGDLCVLVGHARNSMVIDALAKHGGESLDMNVFKKPAVVDPGGVMLVAEDWTLTVPPVNSTLVGKVRKKIAG